MTDRHYHLHSRWQRGVDERVEECAPNPLGRAAALTRAKAAVRRTIHNERLGVPVSSDDESSDGDGGDDDDELQSRVSRRSSATIHNEANGIWVSSDEEDAETASERLPRRPRYDGARQSLLARRHRANHMVRRHSGNNGGGRALSIDPHTAPPPQRRQGSPFMTSSPASQLSSTSSSGRTEASNYWSSSGSEVSRASTVRRRRSAGASHSPHVHAGWQHTGFEKLEYDSFESVSLSSTTHGVGGGYTSASSGGTPRKALARASSLRRERQVFADSSTLRQPALSPYRTYQQQPAPPYQQLAQPEPPLMASAPTTKIPSYPLVPEPSAVQLHAVQFWDPTGSKAHAAERGCQLCGFGAALVALLQHHFVWCAALLALTVLCSSYLSTMYRLLSWRKFSGIEHQAVFNALYEETEQVATDTRMAMGMGEMKPRLVCAGELGAAIHRHAVMLDAPTKLRFWVEACVHFRLTLRSGCHHLAQGKLHTRTLTSASLAMSATRLPTTMCASCDNKTAIEAKFPLKCD